MINIWFKIEDKIQNTSKVIVFTRNHTEDNNADDDGTKNQSGGRHNITKYQTVACAGAGLITQQYCV